MKIEHISIASVVGNGSVMETWRKMKIRACRAKFIDDTSTVVQVFKPKHMLRERKTHNGLLCGHANERESTNRA